MRKINNLQKRIDIARERYFKIIKGKESLLKIISEAELSEHVYNSNAIENSTLTLEETEKILLEIDLNRYIPSRELFEAKNLATVMEYIENNATQKEMSLDMMLFLHKVLISNIRDDIAGRWRKGDEFVRVGSHITPAPKEIVSRLTDTLNEYKANTKDGIVRRIAKLHLDFEYTHPFIDGNGRIGRVINNYILIREGYVPINIKFTDRQKYYDAFKAYDKKKDTEIMEEIIGLSLLQSYYKRLAYMENKKIVTLAEYSKKHKISLSNLINKAHRGTVEAFIDRGVWKIGV